MDTQDSTPSEDAHRCRCERRFDPIADLKRQQLARLDELVLTRLST